MGQQRILEGTGVVYMFPLKCVGIDQLAVLVIIFSKIEEYCSASHIFIFHCYHRDQ